MCSKNIHSVFVVCCLIGWFSIEYSNSRLTTKWYPICLEIFSLNCFWSRFLIFYRFHFESESEWLMFPIFTSHFNITIWSIELLWFCVLPNLCSTLFMDWTFDFQLYEKLENCLSFKILNCASHGSLVGWAHVSSQCNIRPRGFTSRRSYFACESETQDTIQIYIYN